MLLKHKRNTVSYKLKFQSKFLHTTSIAIAIIFHQNVRHDPYSEVIIRRPCRCHENEPR